MSGKSTKIRTCFVIVIGCMLVSGLTAGIRYPYRDAPESGEAMLSAPWSPQEEADRTSDAIKGIPDPGWGDIWTNTVICSEPGDQNNPQLVPDGTGGAIITWTDYRYGLGDIFAQRVDSTGEIQWYWEPTGVHIGAGFDPQLTPDGAGGAIITWTDYTNVYVQRVNSGGSLWPSFVQVSTAGMNYNPHLVPDGEGGAIITWIDSVDFTIYAGRVTGNGSVMWPPNLQISPGTVNQFEQSLIPDGEGGAIITWHDFRANKWDIYAQRVDSGGNLVWGPGTAVCTADEDQTSPQLVTDGIGGAIITWQDYRDEKWDIYVGYVNRDGSVPLTDGTAVCDAAGDQIDPQIVPDGRGGAIIAWTDYRGDTGDIFAQRVGGSALWAENGVAISTNDLEQSMPRMVPDGQGGTVITWIANQFPEDSPEEDPMSFIYAQRVNRNGVSLWEMDGILVSIAPGMKNNPSITVDNRWLSGNQQAQSPDQDKTANEFKGAIIVWEDMRDLTDFDIYAHAVFEDGAEFVANYWLDQNWGDALTNTKLFDPINEDYRNPVACMDGQGGFWVAAEDWSGASTRILVERLTQLSQSVYSIHIDTSSSAPQMAPQMVPDGRGGVHVFWEDHRNLPGVDIYGRHVPSSGIPGAVQGICTAPDMQTEIVAVPDGSGGAWVAWVDHRGSAPAIYTRGVNAYGTPTGPEIVVGEGANMRYGLDMAQDGRGGFHIVWVDERNQQPGNPNDLYSNHVSRNGSISVSGGHMVSYALGGEQIFPRIIHDGRGGAWVVWEDTREDMKRDLYGMNLGPGGGSVGLEIEVCTDPGDQRRPQLAPDGRGGFHVVWEDERDYPMGDGSDIYGRRMVFDPLISDIDTASPGAMSVSGYEAMGENRAPVLIPNGGGGAFVVWNRLSFETDNWEIMSKNMEIDFLPTLYELPVSIAQGFKGEPVIVPNAQGGAYIIWVDGRNNDEVYAQNVHLTKSTVLINEVMFDPSEGDQWYELFNPTGMPYDLEGWKVLDADGNLVHNYTSTMILPGDYPVEYLSGSPLGQTGGLALMDPQGAIRDFLAWGTPASPPTGQYYDLAVSSENWDTGQYVDTTDSVQGDTLGRDMNSTDSNQVQDWDITCGVHADSPTPGTMNIVGADTRLEIEKTAPLTANPGEEFIYTIHIENVGTGTAANVMVTEFYPAWVIFQYSIPAPSYGDNVWDLGIMHANETETIDIIVQVSAFAEAGVITNTATLDYENDSGIQQPQESDSADTKIAFQRQLEPGWNLVSIPLEMNVTAVGDVLSSVSGSWDVVKYYQGTANTWLTHRVGSSVNTLAHIDRTMGVWVHAAGTCLLSVHGNRTNVTHINLFAGWNLVGYPAQTPMTASEALAGTGAYIIGVYDSAPPFVVDFTELDLVIMEPGNGYWVRVPADTIWTVDWQ